MNAVYSSRTFGGDKRRAWEAVVSQLYASMDVQVRGVPEFQGEITHCLLDDLDLTHVIADYEIATAGAGISPETCAKAAFSCSSRKGR